MRALCEKFLTEYRSPGLKNRAAYIANARSVLSSRVWPALEDRPAAKVTPADLDALRDALLADDYKPRSVILAFAVLGKVYEWARRQKVLEVPNPVRAIEKPRKGPSSLELLGKHEVGRCSRTRQSTRPTCTR